jgi:vacuolar protein sorting-associated protein 13B
MLSVTNNTDFNLFVAQTDMKTSAKYILPHKEISDEKWLSWFQVIPSKQKVFYTPPTINEHFPEIFNPDYGIIFACVSGDEFIRWSLPIKIDDTKKIIINVPMFGDLKILVDVRSKTSEININYIDAEDQGFVEDNHVSFNLLK